VSDTCIYFLIFVKCWKQSSILEVNDFSKLLYIYSYCIISSLNWSSLNRDEFHTILDWTKTHITWRPNTSQGPEHKMHVQSLKKNFLHMETNIRVSIVLEQFAIIKTQNQRSLFSNHFWFLELYP
jgi:hypothetical protein